MADTANTAELATTSKDLPMASDLPKDKPKEKIRAVSTK